MRLSKKDWIDAELDFSKEEWNELLRLSAEIKRNPTKFRNSLTDKTLFILTYNQSLRTRIGFEVAIRELGGFASVLTSEGIYKPALKGEEIPYSTERISDIAKILSSYGHGLAMRMYGDPTNWIYGKGNHTLKEFGKNLTIPMISMECDKFHPGEALSDMFTLRESLGNLEGRKLVISWAYSGSTHKPLAVPQSALLAATKMGMDVVLAYPEEIALDSEIIKTASSFAEKNKGNFSICHDMEESFKDADAVYPKSWGVLSCFGSEKVPGLREEESVNIFNKYKHWICDEKMMKNAKPGAKYMHCLPCDRGQEVTDNVVDGENSLAFQQAYNRLHTNKSILLSTM